MFPLTQLRGYWKMRYTHHETRGAIPTRTLFDCFLHVLLVLAYFENRVLHVYEGKEFPRQFVEIVLLDTSMETYACTGRVQARFVDGGTIKDVGVSRRNRSTENRPFQDTFTIYEGGRTTGSVCATKKVIVYHWWYACRLEVLDAVIFPSSLWRHGQGRV
jgi:hypothetical protein